MEESEEKLKSLLMRMKEESEIADLKLSFQKIVRRDKKAFSDQCFII